MYHCVDAYYVFVFLCMVRFYVDVAIGCARHAVHAGPSLLGAQTNPVWGRVGASGAGTNLKVGAHVRR